MYRTILAFGIVAAVAASSPALAADLPTNLDNYSTELKLKIAIAISPRSPPVKMHLTRSAERRPVIYGTTDLPDGTILQVQLTIPWLPDGQERVSIGLPACRINCIPIGDRVIVKNGTFRTGPLSQGSDNPLYPGVYPLEVIVETGNWNGPNPDCFTRFTPRKSSSNDQPIRDPWLQRATAPRLHQGADRTRLRRRVRHAASRMLPRTRVVYATYPPATRGLSRATT
jgi:hypothetical protein